MTWQSNIGSSETMGMMKNYLLKLLQQCSEEQFGQDAIEWAVVSGRVHLTYDFDRDIRECMTRYDEIIEGYRLSMAPTANKPPVELAPMERAAPRRRVKAGDTIPSVKKKHAA